MPKKKKKLTKQVLIDGDPFAYQAAASCEEEDVQAAYEKVDELLEKSIEAVLWSPIDKDYQVFLTGKNNFRHEIAVTHKYKANRPKEKPLHLHDVRNYMIAHWSAIVSDGEEADDLIGIWSTKRGKDAIVISVDKDMMQLPCDHYNPRKGTYLTVSEFDGLKFFYTQILTGDSSDNIKGIYGVGPKKAAKILEDCKTEQDLYQECVRAYGGDEDRVVENARLLWLRRKEEQIWQPPKFTDSDQD